MLERALTKTHGQGHCVLFPKWVDTETIHLLEQPSPCCAKLGIPEDAIVPLYSVSMAGSPAALADPGRRPRVASRAQVPVRHGRLRLHLRATQAASLGPGQHALAAVTPQERVNAFLNLADIHLLPQKEDAADLVMPSKPTGMLASGRLVIATARPGTQDVGQAGLVVEPG